KAKVHRRKKRYAKRHQKARKVTTKLSDFLEKSHQPKLKTNVEAEKGRKFFQTWIENLRDAFDMNDATCKMISKYNDTGKILNPANDEINLAVYRVIKLYLDPLTSRSLSHHYSDGTALLRDLIHICNADTEEVGDEIKREFETMKIGQTEAGSLYIIRVKAKANDARQYHKKITDEEMYKKAMRRIGRTHKEYGSLIMTQDGLPPEKQNLAHLEYILAEFDRERNLNAAPSKREFAGHTNSETSFFGKKTMKTDSSKTSKVFKSYCTHCGFYGHPEAQCKFKQAGKPPATEAERAKRKIYCSTGRKVGRHDTKDCHKGTRAHMDRSDTPPPSILKRSVVFDTEKELGLCACHREQSSAKRGILGKMCESVSSIFKCVSRVVDNIQHKIIKECAFLTPRNGQLTLAPNIASRRTYQIGFSIQAQRLT
ncbi:MAG: hypothetical protein ACREOZ_00440, partial [Gloeomargaritales cyanobacterium]